MHSYKFRVQLIPELNPTTLRSWLDSRFVLCIRIGISSLLVVFGQAGNTSLELRVLERRRKLDLFAFGSVLWDDLIENSGNQSADQI